MVHVLKYLLQKYQDSFQLKIMSCFIYCVRFAMKLIDLLICSDTKQRFYFSQSYKQKLCVKVRNIILSKYICDLRLVFETHSDHFCNHFASSVHNIGLYYALPMIVEGHIVLPLSVRTYVRPVVKFCVKVHFFWN